MRQAFGPERLVLLASSARSFCRGCLNEGRSIRFYTLAQRFCRLQRFAVVDGLRGSFLLRE